MKKLTLLLLLIPILNNGQSVPKLCGIDSIDKFKRYSTEYNYEKVAENDDYISYALEPIGKEDPDTMLAQAFTMYMPKENVLSWAFVMENISQAQIYNGIYSDIKIYWNYLEITDINGTDYVTYQAPNTYEGCQNIKLGFSINDGIGTIVRF